MATEAGTLMNSAEAMHICMITDDNYVLPTKAAIQSVSDAAKRPCVLHLITSALSEQTEADFNAFNETLPNVTIAIHRENAEERFQNFHTYEKNGICVASIAALLKFLIPEIYPELDKMLYLDGDLIVVNLEVQDQGVERPMTRFAQFVIEIAE